MTRFIALLITFYGSTSFAQRNIQLMTYNIRNAKGMDNKTDYERIAGILNNSKAGIIGLQELDSATKRNGGEDVLKILAAKTGYFPVYAAAIAYQGGKYGVGVLSKEKPLQYYSIPLPGKEEERVLLVVVFKKYVAFCTHLSLTAADRLTSAIMINTEAEKFNQPVFLMGDLNAEPGSEVIQLLKQKWKLISGKAATFPATAPVKCIDYIFSVNTKIKIQSTAVLDEPLASDHRPVLVEVKVR